MKKFLPSLAAAMLLVTAIFLAGCQTTADHAHSGQMASLVISGHTEVEILRAMKAVFLADGYEHTSDLIFDKKGSAWDTAAYGGWFSGSVWIRLKATVDAAPNGDYVIGCDAYRVIGRNEGVMEEEHKATYSERSECKKILDEIKTRLASGSSETHQP